MLKNILMELNNSKAFSRSNIAIKLNITEDMVDQLLQQLIHMGCLKEDLGSPACETTCGGCPYANMCGKNPVTIYSITEKGLKLIGDN